MPTEQLVCWGTACYLWLGWERSVWESEWSELRFVISRRLFDPFRTTNLLHHPPLLSLLSLPFPLLRPLTSPPRLARVRYLSQRNPRLLPLDPLHPLVHPLGLLHLRRGAEDVGSAAARSVPSDASLWLLRSLQVSRTNSFPSSSRRNERTQADSIRFFVG